MRTYFNTANILEAEHNVMSKAINEPNMWCVDDLMSMLTGIVALTEELLNMSEDE